MVMAENKPFATIRLALLVGNCSGSSHRGGFSEIGGEERR